MKINASLDHAKFKVRINRRTLDLGDDPEIIQLTNPADMTYSGLSANLPIIGQYNQWRIDKLVVHWRMKNRTRAAWRGDLVNHALVYTIPNDTTGADGSLEDLMYTSNVDKINNILQNYTQLRGVKYRKVKYEYGSRVMRPYITEWITTLAKNSTAAPTQIGDVRRNYKKSFRYASSAVRYEAPLFMAAPGLKKIVYDITGTLTGAAAGDINLDKSIDEYPQLEVYTDVYVTCKQYKNFSSATTPTVLRSKPIPEMEPIANEINLDFNKVKEDVKDSVMDQITNSHPVLGAVAAIAGLRKRPRDEFKM